MSELKDEDFQPVELKDKENLPAIGQRCLFILRSWKDKPVRNGFRVYGYRDDKKTIYIPLYKTKLNILCVKSWHVEPGAPFYDGNL